MRVINTKCEAGRRGERCTLTHFSQVSEYKREDLHLSGKIMKKEKVLNNTFKSSILLKHFIKQCSAFSKMCNSNILGSFSNTHVVRCINVREELCFTQMEQIEKTSCCLLLFVTVMDDVFRRKQGVSRRTISLCFLCWEATL